MSLLPPHQLTSSTLFDVSPVVSLKVPHGPLTFPAFSTAAPGAGSFPAFNTPPTFGSRTAETFFSLPVYSFAFMQAGTFSQVLSGAAPAFGHAFPSTLSSANVFAPLSLGSTLVFSFIIAPVSRFAVVPTIVGNTAFDRWTWSHNFPGANRTRLSVYWAALRRVYLLVAPCVSFRYFRVE